MVVGGSVTGTVSGADEHKNGCVCGAAGRGGVSRGPRLHVAQHGLEALHVWGVSVSQLVRQATVKAERLQLQPDEAKTVLVKEHKQPWGALRTGEAMSCD